MIDTECRVSKVDCDRLQNIIAEYLEDGTEDERETARVLSQKLCNAIILTSDEIPHDTVTMNSFVRLSGNACGRRVFALVYPSEGAPDEGRMSILDPIGTQILGHRKGSVVECDLPVGRDRILIEDVIYQPESAGHFDL